MLQPRDTGLGNTMDWFKYIFTGVLVLIFIATVAMMISAAHYHSEVVELCKRLNGRMVADVCIRKNDIVN